MEQVHARRLKRLARYLIRFDAKQNAKHFRMRQFLEHDHVELSPTQALAQQVLAECYCETVACAVGHAPILFPALMRKFDKEAGSMERVYSHTDFSKDPYGTDIYVDVRGKPNWSDVSRYLFGINSGSREFGFLFGGEWDSGKMHDYRSTSWAVADRILYLIDNPIEEYPSIDDWQRYSTTKGLISEEALEKQYQALKRIEREGVIPNAIAIGEAY